MGKSWHEKPKRSPTHPPNRSPTPHHTPRPRTRAEEREKGAGGGGGGGAERHAERNARPGVSLSRPLRNPIDFDSDSAGGEIGPGGERASWGGSDGVVGEGVRR